LAFLSFFLGAAAAFVHVGDCDLRPRFSSVNSTVVEFSRKSARGSGSFVSSSRHVEECRASRSA
jgi:hypothetical protein